MLPAELLPGIPSSTSGCDSVAVAIATAAAAFVAKHDFNPLAISGSDDAEQRPCARWR